MLPKIISSKEMFACNICYGFHRSANVAFPSSTYSLILLIRESVLGVSCLEQSLSVAQMKNLRKRESTQLVSKCLSVLHLNVKAMDWQRPKGEWMQFLSKSLYGLYLNVCSFRCESP